MKNRNLRTAAVLLAFVMIPGLSCVAPAFGAGVTVPSLELFTWGRLESGEFGFDTRGDIDLRVDGGYKFAGRLLFGFSASTLETVNLTDVLRFTSASVTIRQLFGLPLDFTYFVGKADTFGTGDLFPELFGTPPIASRYPSFVHFADSDYTYEGIYSPRGTGLELDWMPGEGRMLLAWYLYQDSGIDEDPATLDWGHFSTDFRAAFNFNRIKLEAFVGATYPVPDGSLGYYRGGLSFYAAEQSIEFLAQIGVPRWNPTVDSIDIDLLYVLVEPRVRFGAFAIVPTFFWRPRFSADWKTGLLEDAGEQAFDVNLDLHVGKPGEWPIAGGIEGSFVYQTEIGGAPANQITAKASPYLRLLAAGVSWELRVATKLYPFVASELVEVFLTVDAEF